jgi:hypothetical protein
MRPVYMVASIADAGDPVLRLRHDVPFTDKLEAQLFMERLKRVDNPVVSNGHVVLKFYPETMLICLGKYFRDRVK